MFNVNIPQDLHPHLFRKGLLLSWKRIILPTDRRLRHHRDRQRGHSLPKRGVSPPRGSGDRRMSAPRHPNREPRPAHPILGELSQLPNLKENPMKFAGTWIQLPRGTWRSSSSSNPGIACNWGQPSSFTKTIQQMFYPHMIRHPRLTESLEPAASRFTFGESPHTLPSSTG